MLRPAEQIVGRTAELEPLNEALADLARRRASALEVVGEPGIGKTRLLAGRAPGAAVASLTERELQVASLIVDCMTNAEIAATLFLSQKTVETHIRNLFHKLGVNSRVEVARAVERSGSTP